MLVSGQHHLQKLLPVDLPVGVGVRKPEHLFALLLREGLPEPGHGLPELALRYAAVAVMIESPG